MKHASKIVLAVSIFAPGCFEDAGPFGDDTSDTDTDGTGDDECGFASACDTDTSGTSDTTETDESDAETDMTDTTNGTSDTDETDETEGTETSGDPDNCGFVEGWNDWSEWDPEWSISAGDYLWSYQNWMPHDGDGHSGSESVPDGVEANSMLQRTFTVSSPATVSFWAYTVIDDNDFFEVHVDGETVLAIGPTGQYVQQSFDLPEGSSSVEFSFERMPGGVVPSGFVLLDSIEIICGP